MSSDRNNQRIEHSSVRSLSEYQEKYDDFAEAVLELTGDGEESCLNATADDDEYSKKDYLQLNTSVGVLTRKNRRDEIANQEKEEDGADSSTFESFVPTVEAILLSVSDDEPPHRTSFLGGTPATNRETVSSSTSHSTQHQKRQEKLPAVMTSSQVDEHEDESHSTESSPELLDQLELQQEEVQHPVPQQNRRIRQCKILVCFLIVLSVLFLLVVVIAVVIGSAG